MDIRKLLCSVKVVWRGCERGLVDEYERFLAGKGSRQSEFLRIIGFAVACRGFAQLNRAQRCCRDLRSPLCTCVCVCICVDVY